MGLRFKILLPIITINIIIIALIYVIFSYFVTKNFDQLEQAAVKSNIKQVTNSIAERSKILAGTNKDYARWDDTYSFIKDLNMDYVDRNIVASTFTGPRLDYTIFFDLSGKALFNKGFDIYNNIEVPVPDSLVNYLTNNVPEIMRQNEDDFVQKSGLVLVNDQPIFVSLESILTGDETGPSRGILVMTRYLDEQEIAKLNETTNLSTSFYLVNDLPNNLQKIYSTIEKHGQFVLPAGRNSITGYSVIRDVFNKPILVSATVANREIYQQGQQIIFYISGLLAIVGFISLLLLSILIEFLVIRPLSKLRLDVTNMASSKNLSTRINVSGRDEIAGLKSDINTMVNNLQNVQATLKRTNVELERKTKTLEDTSLSLALKTKQLQEDNEVLEKLNKSILEKGRQVDDLNQQIESLAE